MFQFTRKKAFIFTAFSVIAAYTFNQSEATAPESQYEHALSIGVLKGTETFPLFLAENQKIDHLKDLELSVITFDQASARDLAFRKGEIDLMVTDLVRATLFKLSGIHSKVLSHIGPDKAEQQEMVLMASAQSGIKSLDELRGRTVAVASNSINEFSLDQLLRKNLLFPTDVVKVNSMKNSLRFELLKNGHVDATLLSFNQAQEAEEFGATRLVSGTTLGENHWVIVTKEETIQNHTESINRLLATLSKTVRLINKSPNKFQNKFLAWTKDADTTNYSKVPYFSSVAAPETKSLNEVFEWLQEDEHLNIEITYEDLVAPKSPKAI